IPVEILARGQNLATSTPSYYAVSVTRGLEIDLVRVVNGVQTNIGSLKSAQYLSGKWLQVSLTFSGDQLPVQALRDDTGQDRNSQGQWTTSAVNALQATDNSISGGGRAGVERAARYAGPAYLDNFTLLSSSATILSEDFDSTNVGSLPVGWSGWNNSGSPMAV